MSYRYVYGNKNTWGSHKKYKANQKQHCKQACATKNSDISWGQKLTLPKLFQHLEWHAIVFSQLWLVCYLATFFVPKCYKSDQVTKLLKDAINYCMLFKVLYVHSFGKVTTWAQLIFRSHLPVCNVASDWPITFLCPRCFCLAYHYYFVESHKQMLLWSLILKNSSKQFFNFQYRVIHQYRLCICKLFAKGPSYDNYQPAV